MARRPFPTDSATPSPAPLEVTQTPPPGHTDPAAPAALERVSDPWGLGVTPDDAPALEELERLRLEVAELRARAHFAQERLRAYQAPLETALGDALRVALTGWGFRFGFGVVREVALETFDRWEAEGHG